MKKYLISLVAIIISFGSIVHAAFPPYTTGQGGTGSTTPSGILYGSNSNITALQTVVIGSNLTFSGGTLSASVTGSNSIATSTAETAGQLPYWTSTAATPATLGKVATSTFPSISGPFVVPSTLGALVGGSGSITYTGLATTSQPSSSNLLVSNGAAGVYGVATTSETCGAGVSCASHNVLTGGGQISLAALGSAGVLGAVTATTPTVQATSTLYGAASIGGYVLQWSNATNGLVLAATSTVSAVTSVTGGWPIISSGGATPNITFGGLSTSTAAIVGNIPYFSGVNTFANVATSTLTVSGPFTYPTISVVGNNGAITYTGLATTSQPSSSNLLVSNGTSGVYGVATSTLTCTGAVSCAASTLVGTASSINLATISANSVLANNTSASAVPSTLATSSLFTLGNGLTQSTTLFQQKENRSFTLTGTTTAATGGGFNAITGTSTVSMEVGYGEVWNNIKCYTDIGTLAVQIGYGTASTTMFVASTTIGTVTLSSNNTMTSGNKVLLNTGSPASSPTQLSCTVNDTI